MSYPEPWTNASAYRKMKNLEAENARLKAEVERLRKDRDLLFDSHKAALADIQRLHWDLRTAKEGKPSV